MASEVDHAPDLNPGAAGDVLTPWVTYLQQLLTAAGSSTYSGPINGVFDSVVEASVKRVQTAMAGYARDHGQPEQAVDGVVTHAVWEWIYGAASTHEAIDEMRGSRAAGYRVPSDEDAGDDGRRVAWDEVLTGNEKLAPGREIGRSGWVAGSVQCTIWDFGSEPYRGPVYIAFEAIDGSKSDESGEAQNGMCTLPRLWLPREGHLRVTLHGATGHNVNDYLHGMLPEQLHITDDSNISIDIKQHYEEKFVTIAEAEANGWVRDWTVQEGIGFKVEAGPAELSWSGTVSDHGGSSHTRTDTVSEQVKVRVAMKDLQIVKTG